MNTKTHRVSKFDRQLIKLAEQYAEETGVDAVDPNDVASWAEANGHFDIPVIDAKRRFAKQISHALSKEFIEDDDGEPVRKKLPFTVMRGEKQLTFWKDIRKMTPEQYRISASSQRKKVRGEVLQIERNTRYFNKHVNPGDPVQLSFNFDLDILESRMPVDYSDEPPDESA